jgi:hypothetical protein
LKNVSNVSSDEGRRFIAQQARQKSNVFLPWGDSICQLNRDNSSCPTREDSSPTLHNADEAALGRESFFGLKDVQKYRKTAQKLSTPPRQDI